LNAIGIIRKLNRAKMPRHESTFFGIVVEPNYDYKTLLRDTLLLTRAVIDPNAQPGQTARLILQIDQSRGPLCQLDGGVITTVPLNVQIHSGADIVLTVNGDVPIHVTGFYEANFVEAAPQIVPAAFDLGSP
jgi:hypothetical protein